MGRGPRRGVTVHLGLEMSVEDRVPGWASRTTASDKGKGWYANSVPGEGFTVWRCSSTRVPSGFRGSRAPTQLEATHLEQCLQCRELYGIPPALRPSSRRALASSFGRLRKSTLRTLFHSPTLGMQWGVGILWPPPELRQHDLLAFFWGSLPREGEAAFLDLESGLEDVRSRDFQFPSY